VNGYDIRQASESASRRGARAVGGMTTRAGPRFLTSALAVTSAAPRSNRQCLGEVGEHVGCVFTDDYVSGRAGGEIELTSQLDDRYARLGHLKLDSSSCHPLRFLPCM
jgi:hypothetical protein